MPARGARAGLRRAELLPRPLPSPLDCGRVRQSLVPNGQRAGARGWATAPVAWSPAGARHPPPVVGLATRCARGSAPCRRRRHGAGGPAGGRAARESGRREPGRPECVRRPRSGHVPARAPQPASRGTRVSRLALAAPPARSSSAHAPWGGPEVSERTRGRGVRLSLRGPGARPGRLPNPHLEPRPGLCAGALPGLGAPGRSDWDAGPGWGAARAGMPARWAGGSRGPSRCWGGGAAVPMSRW